MLNWFYSAQNKAYFDVHAFSILSYYHQLSPLFNVQNDRYSLIFNIQNDRYSLIFNIQNDRYLI
jgi:predicted nucleic-acid-binding Zn-ribbon protein